jgi:hypothetical protein
MIFSVYLLPNIYFSERVKVNLHNIYLPVVKERINYIEYECVKAPSEYESRERERKIEKKGKE